MLQETLNDMSLLVGQLRHDPDDQRIPNAGHAKPKFIADLSAGKVPWSQYKVHFNLFAELKLLNTWQSVCEVRLAILWNC